MTTLRFLVYAVLVAGPVQAGTVQEEAAAPEPAELQALAPLLRELAAAGFSIEPAGLRVETRTPAECAEDLDAQQDTFFEPGHFPTMWVLYRGIGLALGARPQDARAAVGAALAATFVAYYDFSRDTLVLIDSAKAGLANREAVLVHELVHAWQDRAGDLEAFYRRGPQTLEQTRIEQCLVEGAAEAATLLLLLEREGKTLEEAVLDDTLAKLTAGQAVSSLYTVGRRYALARVAEDGKAWFARALETLPASTEQVIHPEKRGTDVPREVELPAWPVALGAAELVQADTIGELGLFGLVSEAGASESEAWRVAIGWDGDRLRTWRTEDDAYVLLWRLVFDRPEDAAQFEAHWSRFRSGTLRRAGPAVTWVFGVSMAERRDLDADDARLAALLDAVEALAPPSLDAGDAATTALLEAGLPEEVPAASVSDGRWQLPALRLSFSAPEGWTSEHIAGRDYLLGPPASGFRDNLNVLVLPNAEQASAADLLALNQRELEQAPGFELHRAALVEVDGREALRLNYAGEVSGLALEFACVILLREDEQIVATATVLASRAEAILPEVEAALLGARCMD